MKRFQYLVKQIPLPLVQNMQRRGSKHIEFGSMHSLTEKYFDTYSNKPADTEEIPSIETNHTRSKALSRKILRI